MSCNCYVRRLTIEDKFALRYGAHNPTCSQYRASLDPVDRAEDQALRQRIEGKSQQYGTGGSDADYQ